MYQHSVREELGLSGKPSLELLVKINLI